jgi:RND family efflux transporter MFP subunit
MDAEIGPPSASPAAADGLSLGASARPRTLTVVILLTLAALALSALFAAGFLPLHARERGLAGASERNRVAPQSVVVVSAKPGAAAVDLLLPGDCMADRSSDLFARANGYLKSWAVDIGDRVKAGQALCTIETPELDEELHQAEAALAQSRAHVVTAQANGKLTAITLKRYTELRETKVISEQDYSERLAADESAQAELEAARADVLVAEANLRRLSELRSFETMVAPYDGVISARNTEIGALVTAGSGTGARALFSIARTDVLRIFVDVPQTPALALKNGQEVSILAREYPKRPFAGQVTRNAGVIDPTSRTLRVEIRVPNEEGLLLAGMYVQVAIKVPQAAPPLLVPGSTLVFNGAGNQLALVRGGHVHFQAVTVAGDYGKEVGISAGLLPTDQIITNPSSALVEDAVVEAVPAR